MSFFHGIDAAYRCMRRSSRKEKRCKKISECSEGVEFDTVDFSLNLCKSSKLNTCSPFLSLFSRLVLSIRSMFINLPRVLRCLFAGLETIYPGK